MEKMPKKKYIPHLAEFYFEPEGKWNEKEAKNLYLAQNKHSNKIYYRDCIKGMDEIQEESVDLVIADPPFGIDFSGKEALYNRKSDNVVDNYQEIIDDYSKFSINWIKKIPKIMKDTGSAYIVSGYTNLKDVLVAIDETNLHLKNHIIWEYQFGVFTKSKFVSSHYHILFLVKNPKKYYFHRMEHYTSDVWSDVWTIPRKYNPNQLKNGTKLPGKLVQKMIDFSSKPGDLIFDPFMGNGTTAVTAKKNFRHYLGFESNLKMKNIIDSNIDASVTGEDFIPYKKRLDPPEIMAERDKSYKKAYEIYKEREGIVQK